jgi:hypothetical protein
MLAPNELTWTDAPAVAPGARIALIEGPLDKAVPFTFRLTLPANAKIARHTHPAYERVTVHSGRFYFTSGDTYDPARTPVVSENSSHARPRGGSSATARPTARGSEHGCPRAGGTLP